MPLVSLQFSTTYTVTKSLSNSKWLCTLLLARFWKLEKVPFIKEGVMVGMVKKAVNPALKNKFSHTCWMSFWNTNLVARKEIKIGWKPKKSTPKE